MSRDIFQSQRTIEKRIARVISQKQDQEEIEQYPHYRINEKTLEVWDTKLDRQVNPRQKKNRAGAYIGKQIQLIDKNNKRHELAFDKIVAEQFVSNKNTKVYHLNNDLENCAVDNLVWVDDFHYTLYNPAKYGLPKLGLWIFLSRNIIGRVPMSFVSDKYIADIKKEYPIVKKVTGFVQEMRNKIEKNNKIDYQKIKITENIDIEKVTQDTINKEDIDKDDEYNQQFDILLRLRTKIPPRIKSIIDFQAGDKIDCEIVNIANFGLFLKPVQLMNNKETIYCHISQVTDEKVKKINEQIVDKNENENSIGKKSSLLSQNKQKAQYSIDLNELYDIGDVVKAKVINVDKLKNRVSAGIKPTSDFERLLIAHKNDSAVWLRYVAFTLSSSGSVEQSRLIGERALQMIDAQEEQERINMRVGMLALEIRQLVNMSQSLNLESGLKKKKSNSNDRIGRMDKDNQNDDEEEDEEDDENIQLPQKGEDDGLQTTELTHFRSLLANSIQHSDPFKIYERLIPIITKTQKLPGLGREVCNLALKERKSQISEERGRERNSEKIWSIVVEFYINEEARLKIRSVDNDEINQQDLNSKLEQAAENETNKIMQRMLQSLPKKDHPMAESKAARLFFQSQVPIRGREVMDELIQQFPKRADLRNIYIDLELKEVMKKKNELDQLGDNENKQKIQQSSIQLTLKALQLAIDQCRILFEQSCSLALSSKIMKNHFSRFLDFEQKFGDAKHADHVKMLLSRYAQTRIEDQKKRCEEMGIKYEEEQDKSSDEEDEQ
ncbi:MAG: hypothetical protein EZS28_016211 [Streblomastix strix]|uniref:S1 motif domain-containing protein n=1 Tax=Streblomastix strix TaxID=222440 RepID=A0A5J4W0F2_9EUKA|nr:MAG: hypothetical protein EZS28_016211 [Streblomastix strix]